MNHVQLPTCKQFVQLPLHYQKQINDKLEKNSPRL